MNFDFVKVHRNNLEKFLNLIVRTMEKGPISQFITHHYRHFNSAALVDAAKAYDEHMNRGGKMMLAMAGAMSTAELGISLAEMIRQDKFQIVSCSANNLEEDIMNLVAHSHYYRVPGYRDLTPAQEKELLDNHMNRVTDTCIPEEEAFRRLEHHLLDVWKDMQAKGERLLPYEVMYRLLRSGVLEQYYEIDPKDSWVLAACEKNIPIVVPAWEDCTTGNIFAAHCIKGELDPHIIKNGIETMMFLTDWYKKNSGGEGVGFYQSGGGTAGDFPICVVPMMEQYHFIRFLFRRRSKRENHMGQARRGHSSLHRRVRRYDSGSPDVRIHIGLVRDTRAGKGTTDIPDRLTRL